MSMKAYGKRAWDRKRNIKKFIKKVRNIPFRSRQVILAFIRNKTLQALLYKASMYVLTGALAYYTFTYITLHEHSTKNLVAYVFAIVLFEHYFAWTVSKIRKG